MTRMLALFAAVGALALTAGSAEAGPYSEAFGKCLVRASTPQDREVLVRWIFTAMASHPAVKSIVNVTPEQAETADRAMAAVVQRLIFTECRSDSVATLKNEGAGGFGDGFKALGEVAMQGLATDPNVAPHIMGYMKYIDPAKLVGLANDIQSSPAK